MSEKWMPGPWYVEIGDEEDDKGVIYICHPETCSPDTVICSFPSVTDAEAMANAHLIAAATDLYAALSKTCSNALELGYCRMSDCNTCQNMDALRKARGES